MGADEGLMSAFLIAHVGHWAMYVLYAVPLVVVVGSIVATTLKERGRRRGRVSRSPAP